MDSKTCTGCRTEKPLAEFYVDRQRSDDLSCRCKECIRARKALYQASEAGKIAVRSYRRSPRGRRLERAQRRREHLTERGQHRSKAGCAVMYAIRTGRMPLASQAKCTSAGPSCKGRHEYHHDSYLEADRLRVRCLCLHHHQEWHRKNSPIYPEAME